MYHNKKIKYICLVKMQNLISAHCSEQSHYMYISYAVSNTQYLHLGHHRVVIQNISKVYLNARAAL